MTTETKTNQPTHHAYTVRAGEDNDFWQRLGSMWPHADNKGFTIQLDCIPLDGRITLRVPSDKK